MTGSSFGEVLTLTSFGESHGPAVGGVLDGFPAGVELDLERVQEELDRRKPGQTQYASARSESDELRILSGVFEGATLGTPIAFLFENEDARSRDYEDLKHLYRPGHADRSYELKYGRRDWRGGGRASARETVARVAAGAMARQLLERETGATVRGRVIRLGELSFETETPDWEAVWENHLRIAEPERVEAAKEYLDEVRGERDSVGSACRVQVTDPPAGLGEPVFDKLEARLGSALFSIPAVKAVEIGSGTDAGEMRGSEHNDQVDESGEYTSNNAGGMVGGISDGRPIELRVTFKPTSSIPREQRMLTAEGETEKAAVTGRHDPVLAPRGLPVCEAMVALTLADFWLLQRARHPDQLERDD